MSVILRAIISISLLIAVPLASLAAPLKTYVSEFSVTGAPNKDELKATLQGMLTSRLNPSQVQLVDQQDRAELLISGSYALFGRMFSMDVLLKTIPGGVMSKVFEQGDGQDDLIPAIGRLSQKIERELAKSVPASAPVPTVTTPPATTSKPVAAKTDAPASVQAEAYIVHPENAVGADAGVWSSEPIEGVFNSMALGRLLPSGEREIFVANDHVIRLYLKGNDLKLVAETDVPIPARILTIDTADLDHDGVPELYVTILDREALSSRVYRAEGARLEKIEENLPWFFRGIGQELKSRSIYVQEMGTKGEFFGGVAELVRNNGRLEAGTQQKLPRFGYIFNFNRVSDASGKKFFIVLDEDGHLAVSTADGEEVWKSIDNFGGSEITFKHKDYSQRKTTGDNYHWTALEQRMVSLPGGLLLVPRNEGTFVLGNSRSYNRHSIFALQWTGAMFKEKWHTRQSPSYLADFAYDPALRELIVLEVARREGVFSKGRTVISINKID